MTRLVLMPCPKCSKAPDFVAHSDGHEIVCRTRGCREWQRRIAPPEAAVAHWNAHRDAYAFLRHLEAYGFKVAAAWPGQPHMAVARDVSGRRNLAYLGRDGDFVGASGLLQRGLWVGTLDDVVDRMRSATHPGRWRFINLDGYVTALREIEHRPGAPSIGTGGEPARVLPAGAVPWVG